MAFTTKLKLSNSKFFQENLDELALSGITSVGDLKYLADNSENYVDRSVPDVGYVLGLNSDLQSQIDYISGVTDTNITNINTNSSDITYISGQTDIAFNQINYISGQTDTNTTDISNNYDNIVELSGLTSGYISGATNGLNKIGQDVELGGALTKNTTISGLDTNVLEFSGNSLLYSADYSTNYNIRSIPDVGYVTGITDTLLIINDFNSYSATTDTRIDDVESDIIYISGVTDTNTTDITNNYNDIVELSGLTSNSICTADNGLTKDGRNVQLGGALTKNTDISALNTYDLIFTGGDIKYADDYSSQYTAQSIPDVGWVTGQTGAIDANNGLSREGANIVLGGALTGDTEISGSNTLLISAPYEASNVQYTKFNNTPTITGHEEGRLYYSENSLNLEREFSGVTTQIGEETVVKVTNSTGGLIENGSAVRFVSALFGIPTVGKSIANDLNSATETFGIATQDISDGEEGYITTLGIVRGLNTNDFSAGDILWLSDTTAGTYTNVRPEYPNYSMVVGVVTKVGLTDGEIYVKSLYIPNYTEYGLFTGYTANTQITLDNKLNTSVFNIYSGNTDGRLDDLEANELIAITGATNGLSKVGDKDVKLGGILCENTTINGAFNLTLSPSSDLVLKTTGDNSLNIDAQSNGTLALKSQSGINTNVTTFTNGIGFLIDYDLGFTAYDNRIGSNRTGLQYAADYSTNYVNRSLVDKAYVDSVATGLQAKSAVNVATTENIDLTGGTFASGSTIDGIVVLDGDRVLVKDQTNAIENGIWVFSGTSDTFYRAEDYDGTPEGEVSNGDLIPVITGSTQVSSQWILSTVDPIEVGTSELEFSLFSQLLQLSEGNGIDITNVSGTQEISVELATNSGLEFAGTGVSVADTIAGSGLTWNNGIIDISASDTTVNGTEINVKFGNTNNLVVDSNDFQILTASNGVQILSDNIELGGNTLEKDTTISGNDLYDLNLSNLNSFNLGFNNISTIIDSGNNGGLRYAGDYSSNYVCQSIPDVQYVHDTISGDTILTYNNGITKQGDVISWGGTLTGDTQIIYGAGRICMLDGGTSCVDLISDCSKVHVENTSLCLRSCTNTTCNGTITLQNTGTISLSTNNATQGITITDTGSGKGAVYASDYSSTFVDNSLVNKAYVDNLAICLIEYTTTTPAGNDYEIQFNSGGTFTTYSGLTYNPEYWAFTAGFRAGYIGCYSTVLGGSPFLAYSPNEASGEHSMAWGDGVKSTYNGSTAWGYHTKANGHFSTVWGKYGGANGCNSTAWGHNTKASGDISTVWGELSEANGCGSTAWGHHTIASGDISTAWGNRTIAHDFMETSFGLYNVAGTGETSSFEPIDNFLTIGNGSSDTDRNNVLRMRKDGVTFIDGVWNYTVNVVDGDLVDESLVPKRYVDTCIDSNVSGITSNAITGATNGLTKDGQDVKLGGTLSETTTINGGTQTLTFDSLTAFNATATNIGLTGIVTATGAVHATSTLDVTGATTIGGELILSTVNTGSTTTDDVVLIDSTGVIKKVAADTLGEDNNLYNVTNINNSVYTITGDEYVVLVDTSSGAVTVNLPTTPEIGTAVKIKDKGNALTNNITVDAGTGNTIDGTQTASINTDYGALELVYGEVNKWYSLAFIN